MDEFEPQAPESDYLPVAVGAITTGAACFALCTVASLSTVAIIWAFMGGSDVAFALLLTAPLAVIALVGTVVATCVWAGWNRRTLMIGAIGWSAATAYAGVRIAAEFNLMVAGDTPGLGLGLLAAPMAVAVLVGASFAAALITTVARTLVAIRSHR